MRSWFAFPMLCFVLVNASPAQDNKRTGPNDACKLNLRSRTPSPGAADEYNVVTRGETWKAGQIGDHRLRHVGRPPLPQRRSPARGVGPA